MRAILPIQNSKNDKSSKLENLIAGKGYLEILMYLIAISSSVVILFA